MNKRIPKPIRPKYSFHPPEIPPQHRCDFREDFDAGMTLRQIGRKYHCDQRTVRRCILLNKSSNELGRQYAPTKLQPFVGELETLYRRYLQKYTINRKNEDQTAGQAELHIMQISREITAAISAKGYAGSERTVRNYLRTHQIR